MAKHRLYIDEVGNSDLGASQNENHRYLSLTGVVMSLDYTRDVLHPALDDLKRRYFNSHPDDPVILHRKELVNQTSPFEALTDVDLRTRFDAELMQIIRDGEYQVITAVIDKQEHLNRHRQWAFHPYHYCLTVILERYMHWLRERGLRGDVMAESRGGKEDRKLKEEFTRIYTSGTPTVPHARFVERFTSSQLKIKPKSANVAGLQLADLIAHPSYAGMKARRAGLPIPDNHGGRVFEILEASKYRRSGRGTLDGFGRKWLPS
jgi:hypothetical protein